MSSRMYERYLSDITAQASAAISGNADSTGATVTLNKLAGGNSNGAQWFDCYVDVTVAPSAEAQCQMFISGSPDGTNFSSKQLALSCIVPTTIGLYHLGCYHSTPQKFIATLKAITNSFTASLEIVPVYPADA